MATAIPELVDIVGEVSQYMSDAHWRGNVYARRMYKTEQGRAILVQLISGRNVQATCSQVASRSIPRGWRWAKSRKTIGTHTPHPPAEMTGHWILVPLERIHN